MATTTYVPVKEYLTTTYRPDCDYVDGEVKERTLGEQYHGLVQSALASIFRANRRAWQLRAITEQRVQVSATRYRVPDVCVVPSTDPIHGILQTPPVLCVEVLSPEDRFQNVLERVQEYIGMGVGTVWIIDPMSRRVWTVGSGTGPVPHNAPELVLPNTAVSLPLEEIFAEIDEAPQTEAE